MTVRQRHAAGFSLIEMIIVLGILAIVVGTAVPTVGKAMERSRISETRAELGALGPAISAYFQDTGVFPASFDDLRQNVSGVDGWAGSYLVATVSSQSWTESSLSKDAWNRNYDVSVSGDSQLAITSFGPDGAPGGGDDISQDVDVTPIRRERTLTELKTINTAITAWNAVNLPDNPLPGDYAGALSALVSGGYLPGGTSTYEADGWGDAYIIDPPGSSPVVAATSIHVSPWLDASGDTGSGGDFGAGGDTGNGNNGNHYGWDKDPGKPDGTPGNGNDGSSGNGNAGSGTDSGNGNGKGKKGG